MAHIIGYDYCSFVIIAVILYSVCTGSVLQEAKLLREDGDSDVFNKFIKKYMFRDFREII